MYIFTLIVGKHSEIGENMEKPYRINMGKTCQDYNGKWNTMGKKPIGFTYIHIYFLYFDSDLCCHEKNSDRKSNDFNYYVSRK